MAHRQRTWLALLLGAALAAALPAAEPTYLELRNARPDGRRVALRGVALERDALRFQFEEGTLHLLAPVGGREVGALFVGRGSFTLTPASANERDHLRLRTGEAGLATLTSRFARLLLLATDGAVEALASGAPPSTAPSGEAQAALERLLDDQRRRHRTNLQLRLLRDLVNREGEAGLFLALFDGERLGPALAALDPLGADALGLGTLLGGEEVALYVGGEINPGFWYLAERREALAAGKRTPHAPPADALHYRIETQVSGGTELAGETTVTFRVEANRLRLLPLYLFSKLRVSDVAWSPGDGGEGALWQPAEFVQEHPNEDPDLAVLLPVELERGSTASLRLRYRGSEVLFDVGDDNYAVGARTSWYPNLGSFSDLATFDLGFVLPGRKQVVAVGRKVESRSSPRAETARFRADAPIRVAGFNYGRFKELARRDEAGGVSLQVFTNPGTPGILREIQSTISAATDSAAGGEGGLLPENLDSASPLSGAALVGPDLSNISTGRLAEAALVDAINAARVYRRFYGDLARGEIAITQQSQWSFGQSWPGLVFLPYLSFLHGGYRNLLGLGAIRQQDLDGLVYHELAHQWWGHQVGWASYRDEWLSEGFAEFSAALVLQFANGWGAHDRFYRGLRESLFATPPGNAVANFEAGPLSLGQRLSTGRSADAARAVLYGKGAFVLHMLRMTMRDAKAADPDAAFVALMRDFTATYRDRNATTADFQAMVEKHLVPNLNATGNGKVAWFFDQWVRGTEIPRYRHDLRAEKSGDGYKIAGSLTQEAVGAQFRALVPVYLEFEKKGVIKVADVPMLGPSTRQLEFSAKLPEMPKRVLLNAHFDLLARD